MLVLPATLPGAERDDALRYYLSKSPLVVSGEIVAADIGLSKRGGSQAPYGISLKINRVLKGKVRDKEIGFVFQHFERDSTERLEFLKKNGRVIVFLRRAIKARGEGSGWLGVDPWFAVQPASELLERSLARLVAASESEPEPKPVEVCESGDDTLRYYKSRASLVVSGEVRENSPPAYGDDSTCTRSVRVKVGRIMRGGVQGDEITASVTRFEDKASDPAFLKAGKRVILFLRERKGDPRYETVDPWFGVQQFNSAMEFAIDEVHAE